jgi:hypothetical protein
MDGFDLRELRSKKIQLLTRNGALTQSRSHGDLFGARWRKRHKIPRN